MSLKKTTYRRFGFSQAASTQAKTSYQAGPFLLQTLIKIDSTNELAENCIKEQNKNEIRIK